MPLYPGTGAVGERGEHNQIVNAPLRAGDCGETFREAMEVVILPRVEAFSPTSSSSRRASTPITAIRSAISIWSRRTTAGRRGG